jgi:hypothetical protein
MTVNDTPTTQHYLMRSDGTGERVEIDSIPESWRPWHWPQWGGEAQAAPGAQAEQALPFSIPSVEPSGRAIYVEANATAGGDGSPARPFNTIQAAVDAARKGDTIKVAIGAYKENLLIQGKTLILQGSYLPGWQAVGEAEETIIDGGGRTRTIWIRDGSRVVMEGFTLVNGNAHCTPEELVGGGGIRVDGMGSQATFERVIIRDNIATPPCGGGGIETERATVAVINSLIANNTATAGRAGVNIWTESQVLLLNTSVVGNQPVGVGLAIPDGRGVVLNSIVWDNEGGDIEGHVEVEYSLIGIDPLFVDAANDNYHLEPGSPAIDAGALFSIPSSDIDGEPRPMGAGVDIGADEVTGQVSTAAQARAFAGPILQAIASRQPDVAADFSAVDENWMCGGNPLRTTGECKVADGVARLTPARGAFSDLNHPWMVAGSFVLRIDARQVSGSCASYFQFFLMGPDRWNNLHLNPCQNEASMHVGFGGQPHPELEGGGGPVRPIGEANHIQIIARGPRFAFYLNDAPVAYFEESHLDAAHQIGFRCNARPEMVCEFDNVSFWNLDGVLGLP